jgi:hypothetical protein
MPTTMTDAFAAAETRHEEDRTKAQRRLVRDLGVNAGKRAEVSEIVAAMSEDDIEKCVSIVEKHRRAIDGKNLLDRDDSEDAVQEAIFGIVKHPRGIDTTKSVSGLIVWQAKRLIGWKMRSHRQTASLDERHGHDGDDNLTLQNLIPFDDARLQTLAVLESWYVRLYVKDLMLRVPKSNLEIGTELGIKTAVVEAIRAELRAEEGFKANAHTAGAWTRRTSLAALRYYADEHGVAPTRQDLDSDPNLPPSRRVVELFGSRLNAYKAAGLRLGGKSERFDEDDRAEVAKRIVSRAKELGHWPGGKEMKDPTEIVVGRIFGTVAKRKLYGLVEAELGAAALEGIAVPKRHKPSLAERARDIADWAEREGRWPGLGDFERDSSLPGVRTAYKLFGSVKVEAVRLAVMAMLEAEEAKTNDKEIPA